MRKKNAPDLSGARSGSSLGMLGRAACVISRVLGKSYISTCSQLTPKPLNPPPRDLPTVPFPPPFSFFTDLLLTGETLKCRPRPMKVPICTALEGWGTMDRFGTIDHLHAPLCPLSARTGRLRVYNVCICGVLVLDVLHLQLIAGPLFVVLGFVHVLLCLLVQARHFG